MMARKDSAHPDNASGSWFVDTHCIRCDAARHWAGGLIGMDDQGRSVVVRQPTTAEDEAAMWRAAAACPTRSIGNRDLGGPPADVFPHELTAGVWALGHNPPNGFGSHSYLVTRPSGNLMTDSPPVHASAHRTRRRAWRRRTRAARTPRRRRRRPSVGQTLRRPSVDPPRRTRRCALCHRHLSPIHI